MRQSHDPDADPLSPAGLARLQACLHSDEEPTPPPGKDASSTAFYAFLGQHSFSGAFEALPLGRFVLRRILGQGQFGIVFLADDPSVGRSVALKLPQPGVLFDSSLLERFQRDFLAGGLLDHPGLVPVYEAGRVGSLPYIVSAYVEGPTLAQWLRGRQQPVGITQAVELVLALAHAVQFAHQRGILHCDLKPGNVLLQSKDEGGGMKDEEDLPDSASSFDKSFRPRITDFGLAHFLNRDPALTRTHLIAGSIPYMAPEQARGERRGLTSHCDVYALGAILFEILTGRPPFHAPTEVEMLRRLLDDEPPRPSASRPDIPRDLDAIVTKCLEKAHDQRYPGAADLAEDLGRFLEGKSTVARPIGRVARLARWMRRRPVQAGLGAVAVLAVGLTLLLAGSLVKARLQFLLDLRVAQGKEELQRSLALLERIRQRRVERPRGWSRDNLDDLRALATTAPAAEYLADIRSEAAAALAAVELFAGKDLHTDFRARSAAYSPDGRTLALAEQYPTQKEPVLRVRLLDASTGALRRELTYRVDLDWEARRKWADGGYSLIFSPDGRWLVLGTRSGWILRWNLTVDPPHCTRWLAHQEDPQSDDSGTVKGLAFSEDGSRLLSSSQAWTRRWDVSDRWKQVGSAIPAVLPVGGSNFSDSIHLSFQDGRLTPLDVHTTRTWTDPPRPKVHWQHKLAPGLGLAAAFGAMETPPFWLMRCEESAPLLHLESSPRPSPDNHLVEQAFRPDGRYLVTLANGSRALRLWDSANARHLGAWLSEVDTQTFSFAPNSRDLVVCQDTRNVRYHLWDRGVRQTLALQPSFVEDFSVSADGRHLATSAVAKQSEMRMYQVDEDGNCTLETMRKDHSSATHAIGVSLAGSVFAFRHGRPGGVRVELSNGSYSPQEEMDGLQFTSSGSLWGREANEIVVWDRSPFRKRGGYSYDRSRPTWDRHFLSLAAADWGALAGTRDGKVFRFDARGRLLETWQVFEQEAVSAVALSADASLALIGGGRGTIQVRKLPAGELLLDLPESHADQIDSVAFGHGGILITGSRDHTIKLWSKDGERLLTLREEGPIRKLATSAGGAELNVLVANELGIRRWWLQRLHARLLSLGIDPGFPAPPATSRSEPPLHRGLRAELYVMRLDRDPLNLRMIRVDPHLDHDWRLGKPAHELKLDDFGICWRGWLRPPRAGRYVLAFEVDDIVQLWIDGKLVCERSESDRPLVKFTQGEVDLPDRPVSIRVDYTELCHTAYCRMLWRRSDSPGPLQPVPWEAFFLDRASALRARPPFGPEVPRGITLELLSGETRLAGPFVRPHLDGTFPDDVRKRLPAAKPLTLRYTGLIDPPRPGRYRIAVAGKGKERLWLGGKELTVGVPDQAGDTHRYYTCDIEGRPTPFQVEYATRLEDLPGRIDSLTPLECKWARENEDTPTPVMIPQVALFPDEAAARQAGKEPTGR